MSAELPDGWTLYKEHPDFSIYVGDSPYVDENCDSPTDYTHMNVEVRQLNADNRPIGLVGARPTKFGASVGTGVSSGGADLRCGSRSQAIAFTDHGQAIQANLVFGRDASERRVAQAYSILDSLHVDGSTPK